jgi:septum formation protein
MTHFILASQSPRRRELLELAGFPFTVAAADVDESIVDVPDPALNSVQTARLKAEALLTRYSKQDSRHRIVLAADTNVAIGAKILGKPANGADAREMLRALRGRQHQVYTGMALVDLASGQEVTAVHGATVWMRSYSEEEIADYVAGGDPLDKAGAYGIQHQQFRPVERLDGCFLGVMGLAVCQLHLLLPQLTVRPRTDLAALHSAHQGYACPLYQQLARQQ